MMKSGAEQKRTTDIINLSNSLPLSNSIHGGTGGGIKQCIEIEIDIWIYRYVHLSSYIFCGTTILLLVLWMIIIFFSSDYFSSHSNEKKVKTRKKREE